MSTEPTPEQLTLLIPTPTTASERTTGRRAARTAPPVPVRFRLDEDTRRRGLEHVAEIRRRLAASASETPVRPARRRAA